MKRRTRIGVLGLVLLSIVAFAAAACGNSGSEPATIVNAASVSTASAPSSSNAGPAQVKLGDGPAGLVGSRFSDPDVEIDLTAEVVQWEVLDGEFVEAWVYNGQYPGPEIRAKVGDKTRINLTNNLPEATTIHWHGLEVPNDQDGVPGITQPDVSAGEKWTYEFVAPKAGTMMYHTHSNTLKQLTRGFLEPLSSSRKKGCQSMIGSTRYSSTRPGASTRSTAIHSPRPWKIRSSGSKRASAFLFA